MSDFDPQIKLKSAIVMALLLLTALPAAAFDRRTPVVRAVDRVGPAVVNISSEYQVHNRNNPFGGNPPVRQLL